MGMIHQRVFRTLKTTLVDSHEDVVDIAKQATSGIHLRSPFATRCRVTIDAVTSELERLFSYRGAIDPSVDVVMLDTDMLVLPCWTREFCELLIKAAEATGGFAANEFDPVPAHEISLGAISPSLFERVQDDFGSRIWPQLKSVWPLIEYHGINDAFIIKYEVGQQEELRIHHDVAQVSASIKLNDSYEGAVLEFPRQGKTNELVPVGSMLAWPSLVTHPHASNPILSGVKYSMTIWFELPLALG
jgi:hypothetical protein